MPVATLCVIYDHHQKKLLLAYKKKGFGQGLWNSPGGKPEKNESIETTAIRETAEEIGLQIHQIEPAGDLIFHHPAGTEFPLLKVCVFRALKWSGQIQETAEMKPQWFAINNLPFSQMWPDDIYWLLPVIKGNNVFANFYFDKDRNLISHDLKIDQK